MKIENTALIIPKNLSSKENVTFLLQRLDVGTKEEGSSMRSYSVNATLEAYTLQSASSESSAKQLRRAGHTLPVTGSTPRHEKEEQYKYPFLESTTVAVTVTTSTGPVGALNLDATTPVLRRKRSLRSGGKGKDKEDVQEVFKLQMQEGRGRNPERGQEQSQEQSHSQSHGQSHHSSDQSQSQIQSQPSGQSLQSQSSGQSGEQEWQVVLDVSLPVIQTVLSSSQILHLLAISKDTMQRISNYRFVGKSFCTFVLPYFRTSVFPLFHP
jgi:hypothetical protein